MMLGNKAAWRTIDRPQLEFYHKSAEERNLGLGFFLHKLQTDPPRVAVSHYGFPGPWALRPSLVPCSLDTRISKNMFCDCIGRSEWVKVAQSCSPLRPHGPHSPWNSPGQNTGVGSLSLLQGIFPTQGSNPGLPHCWCILYCLSHQGSPRILEWIAYPFSRGSSWARNQTMVSCIEGGFFTN